MDAFPPPIHLELERTATHAAEAAAIEAENAQLRREILERLAALEAELASVEASLAVLRSHKPNAVLSRSELRVEEQARAEVASTVAELEKALEWETARKEEEEASVARDKLLLADAETLHAALSARSARVAAASSPRASGETLVLRTQGRIAHLSRRFKVLQSALVGFVDGVLADEEADARFARGAEDEAEGKGEGPRKRRRVKTTATFDLRTWIREDPLLLAAAAEEEGEAEGEGETRAFQLKKLIETLMNLSITRPSDPWLSTAPSGAGEEKGGRAFAPELVAFVLRAGIAHEHPREPGRVRLVDFAGVA
ncbi:hypothetical protein JCM10449v2_001500 [Rhodotorula kratochvilovae]